MGKAIGLCIVLALVVFGAPWIVQIAWGMIAVNMFGAPTLPYWAAFFGTWAMHIIFGETKIKDTN